MSRYTQEEKEWLRKNYPILKPKELTENFIKTFNHNTSVHTLVNYCSNRLKVRINKRRISHYTNEQKAWLKENYYLLSKTKLAEQYNNKFNDNKKSNTLICYCTRFLGLDKKDYSIRKNIVFYDKEKIAWLKENYPKYLFYKDLTKAFNERFNTNIKDLNGILVRLGLTGKDRKLVRRMVANHCLTGDWFQEKAMEYFKLEIEIEKLMKK